MVAGGGCDVVPLLGAIVVCYGGGRGWCHCRVPLQCARRVTANFEGVDVVQLLGAVDVVPLLIAGCHRRVPL